MDDQMQPQQNAMAQPSVPAPEPMVNEAPQMPRRGMNTNMLFIGLAVVAVLLTITLVVANATGADIKSWFSFGNSSQKIAQKAVDYINANGLAGGGQTATLGEVSEESGLIKFKLQIGTQSFDSYVTKDGKLLFPQAVNIGGANTTANQTPQPTAKQAPDSSKVVTEKEAFVGDVNAKLVMAFWSDYQCPFCKKAEQEVLPQLIHDYVDTGKVKLVFKDYAFLGPDSQTLAKFARAVYYTAPSKFYAWHKAMYDNQGQENTGWATEAKIMEITTKAIGAADASKALAAFKANDAQYQQEIDASKAEGIAFGITGTPATIVGTKMISGADTLANFKAAIDAELAK